MPTLWPTLTSVPKVSTLGLDFLATLDEKVHAGVNRPYEMFDWQRPRGEK